MVEHASNLVGVVVVRGGGVPMVQRRLPRHHEVSLGRRERHGLKVVGAWLPRDLATFTPVEEGWLVTNAHRVRMRLDTDWVDTGHVQLVPGGIAMLQRGDAKLSWPELEQPFSVSLTLRTRRMDDARIAYAVDSRVGDQDEPVRGTYHGISDTPVSALLRYRLAVLYRHLIEGEAAPAHVLKRRAEFLGMGEEELYEAAQRYRRRLNAVRGTDLDNLDEMGDYLVHTTGELTREHLDP